MRKLPSLFLTPQQVVDRVLHSSITRRGLLLPSSGADGDQSSSTAALFVGARKGDACDYVSHVALRIAKATPIAAAADVGRSLLDDLRQCDAVASCDVDARGKLSVALRDDWLAQRVATAERSGGSMLRLQHDESDADDAQQAWRRRRRRRVVVDHASPNMAKELHVGHLRSAIIGDAIANTLEFLGHSVERVSHVGDVGTPVASVVARAIELGLDWTRRDDAEPPSVGALTQLYIDGKARREADASFAALVDDVVLAMQSLDTPRLDAVRRADCLRSWRAVCNASRQSFDDVFGRLGVRPIERGESHYIPFAASVVEKLRAQRLLREDDGALVADVAGAPLVVRKRDGAYLYASTDLAAVAQRASFDWAIYVVDASQSLHFQQIFSLAAQAGLYDPKRTTLQHVAFGVITGADGRKFSTRRGTGVALDVLLDSATTAARAARQKARAERQSGGVDGALPHEANAADDAALDERVGVAAIKYFDLSHERRRDYRFDLTHMLALHGNTAVFLLYAGARIAALLDKRPVTAHDDAVAREQLTSRELHPSERALLLKLAQFDDTLLAVERALTPHLLCEYAYGLVDHFNVFYRDCRVMGDANELSRRLLVQCTQSTLKSALKLLGITAVDRI